MSDGWPAGSEAWLAGDATGSLVAAVAAALGLGAVGFAAREMRVSAMTFRVQTQPYLRADLVYVLPGEELAAVEARVPEFEWGLRPDGEPQGTAVDKSSIQLSPDDLLREVEEMLHLSRGSVGTVVEAVIATAPPPVAYYPGEMELTEWFEGDDGGGDGVLRLFISVHNSQEAPLGIASDVRVRVCFSRKTLDFDSPLPFPYVEIELPYVEPGYTYLVPLAELEIEEGKPVWIEAAVGRLRYMSLSGIEYQGTHGYLTLILERDPISGEWRRVHDRQVA